MLRAANSIAESKHADQPAAKSCSGLVPVSGLPGRESLTSRRPSELCEIPERPPVVWAFAVYSTFSSRFISSSFMKSPGADALRSSVAIGDAAWLDTEMPVASVPQADPLGPEVTVGHFRHDATYVFVGEEIVAGELTVIQEVQW